MITSDELSKTLDAYCAGGAAAGEYVADLRELIRTGADCISRKEFRGHVTCSALVINADLQVLMIHHRTLDKWLLPGGHVEESDASLVAAAKRELAEETGIAIERIAISSEHAKVPVHIDRHTIPANPAKGEPEHEHWDFCYLLRTNSPISFLQNEEVSAVKWCDASVHADSQRLISILEKL